MYGEAVESQQRQQHRGGDVFYIYVDGERAAEARADIIIPLQM